MNLSIDSLKTSEQEITGCYLECHGPGSRCDEDINDWVTKMINMIGPDDCRFIIRSHQPPNRGLWMAKGMIYTFDRDIRKAQTYSWGTTAVKITNNPKLEAIRIVKPNEALDYKGFSICLDPAPLRIVEAPVSMPNYQDSWEANYGADDREDGSSGKIAQNGEQLPGPCDE